MESPVILVIAGLLGLPLFLLFVGAMRQRSFAAAWELLLTPRGMDHYREMKARLDDDLAMYDATDTRAGELHRLGSVEEAMWLMREGCLLIEHATSDRLRQLAGMALLTRLMFALAPVRPLRPSEFEIGRLSAVARLAWLAHHFLVGAAERLRLRLVVLRYGFRLIARLMRRSRNRLTTGHPMAEATWRELRTIRDDYGTLSKETLESFRAILLGIGAEPQPALLVRDF
jgi:hypothetical protein